MLHHWIELRVEGECPLERRDRIAEPTMIDEVRRTHEFPKRCNARHGVSADSEVRAAAVRWLNDWQFQATARSVARAASAHGVSVFLYDFSRVPPVRALPKETVGAFHSAESVRL